MPGLVEAPSTMFVVCCLLCAGWSGWSRSPGRKARGALILSVAAGSSSNPPGVCGLCAACGQLSLGDTAQLLWVRCQAMANAIISKLHNSRISNVFWNGKHTI
eukprot:1160412-Pelagomonas_calceolata.AAC.2